MTTGDRPRRAEGVAPETDGTRYRHLSGEGVSTASFAGHEVVVVEPGVLVDLARDALRECSFFLRRRHNEQIAAILGDTEASDNDRTVALALLRNAEIAAHGVLPLCQDTGTATVFAKKGQQVWTGVDDTELLSRGIRATYARENLRYSQMRALTLFDEQNTGDNLPAQIDIAAVPGDRYEFLFAAKGGGSANKTMLWQETRARLDPAALEPFLIEKMRQLGTAACPPYHIAIVIGGTSAEACLKAVKLASTGYYDDLPTEGGPEATPFRAVDLEERLLEATRGIGLGAQFGGKHFALDVRVIRLPRHGASCPIGMGVSCVADRNVRARIDRDGVWLEELDHDPGRLIPPEHRGAAPTQAVRIDLDRPMPEVLAELHGYPVSTPLLLTGTLVVARDIAHARFRAMIESGAGVPEYLKRHPVYYAGPAKTPAGRPSGSFGPTTAGRMDSYVDLLQAHGASLIMIAKGNRTQQVTDACRTHGGFYLGSIGGPAALIAEHIRRSACIDFPELGMEAVWEIDVEDFPAFILIDDKGNDFFAAL